MLDIKIKMKSGMPTLSDFCGVVLRLPDKRIRLPVHFQRRLIPLHNIQSEHCHQVSLVPTLDSSPFGLLMLLPATSKNPLGQERLATWYYFQISIMLFWFHWTKGKPYVSFVRSVRCMLYAGLFLCLPPIPSLLFSFFMVVAIQAPRL